jgi:hypothetical protein
MEPPDYKPRQNNYQPLRDQEQKSQNQTLSQDAEAKRPAQEQQLGEESPARPRERILDRLRGGPTTGGMEEHHRYANTQVREAHEMRQSKAPELADEERDRQPGMSARQIINESAQRKHEIADLNERTKSQEIER